MIVKITELRKNLYSILDRVLETGERIQIERNGRVLTIEPDKRPSKLSRLKKRKIIVGDPQDIVHADWSGERNDDLS